MRKILAISASGIGNTILITPVLRSLRKYFPKAQIDLCTWNETMGRVLYPGYWVDHIWAIPHAKRKLFSFLTHLREQRYDYSFCAFPNIRPEYNLFAWMTGARTRVTHAYSHSQLRTLSFLQNCRIPAHPGVHDIENNMALLKGIGIDPHKEVHAPFFELGAGEQDQAEEFLNQEGLNNDYSLIGVHAGCGPLKTKQWGVDNFAHELNQRIQRDPYTAVLLFGSHDEFALNQKLKSKLNTDRVWIPQGGLRWIAALISRCHFFLSNDSGLMHIAACFQIPQKAVFVSSNWKRTYPWNPNSEVLKLNSPDAFLYPFWRVKP